ncbi:hypothetical protein FisN_5Lu384 [Fistulifera solaris]|uniref:Sulfotransferase domain-containing protein n=1 Tax=Fistulifera solaris TaxID=1519565 RepID=A0A1Z5KGR8_FISSO|nr:hypothetical protein FisN_5Lu384 [Fistulifera solaris]|eukprot:GAX25292.1 hypothetical protein FisN_5Lu384 [Fistulifera solaris]
MPRSIRCGLFRYPARFSLGMWGLLFMSCLSRLGNHHLQTPCGSTRNIVARKEAPSQTNDARDHLLVDYGDYIYKKGSWDGAPVVIEDFKLVFFTSAKVGCTVWKQLFRRMMGIPDWKAEQTPDLLPWNSELNGLKYLYDYDRETASMMMTNPEWTRAIFVRDPKERFLSAYLDKAFHKSFVDRNCCPFKMTCAAEARKSAKHFLELIKTCENPHWMPQSSRMEEKYWPFINFVGYMEHLSEDGERLLRQIGAWETYGAWGWGPTGKDSVFQSQEGGGGRAHATGARNKLKQYISQELEAELDSFYEKDYSNPFLRFENIALYR